MPLTLPKVARYSKTGRLLKPSERAPPRPTKFLRRDDRRLPIPSVPNLLVRTTHASRLAEHYHTTLRDDLMYLTYDHSAAARPPPRPIRLTYDPANPYAKFRHNPPVGGTQQYSRTPLPPTTSDNVVRLEKVSLHSFQKNAITNRSWLLGPIMMFRAISGLNEQGGGWRGAEGVRIVRGKKNVGGWIRPGIPAGVKVDLKGDMMYDFIATLVHFVLPRLKDFDGIKLPAASANMKTPSAVSGVVSLGLPPEAMGFFPQIEVNQDAYPKSYGMHIHFVTTAKGMGAQEQARTLLSAFQIPFTRR